MMTRPLGLYLASRFCAGTAMSLLRASLLWHLWALTKSEAMTGLLGLAMVIPGAGLALVGGAVADARDRRRVIQTAQSIASVVSLTLCVTTISGVIVPGLIYGLAAALAACAAFENPSRSALLAQVVERDALPRAVTWGSTVQALAFATGPVVAGAVIARADVATAYACHVMLLLTSIVLLFFVDIVVPATRRAASWAAVVEGLRFVRDNPILLACMALDLVAVVLGGASALLPVFADSVLNVGASGYGMLAAALDVGALAMSIVLLRLPPLRRAGALLLGAVIVYGVCTIAFGLSRSFPMSLLLYGLCGAADQVSVVLRQSAVQLSTPDELRGRVSAVNMIFIVSSNQLSVLESGVVAALIGAPAAVVIGGSGVVVVATFVAITVPALRRFRL
jgi:MFS family permease